MRNRIDIMLDLETLGLDPNESPLIQLSAVAFNITNGEVLAEFNEGVHHEDSIIVDPSTLKWWLETNADLLSRLMHGNNHSEKRVLQLFADFVSSFRNSDTDIYIWGNGIIFDNAFIKQRCKYYGIEYPISYRNDRDVRTYVDAYMNRLYSDLEYNRMKKNSQLSVPNFEEHNAIHDCLAQINLVSYIYGKLEKQ